MILFLDSKLQKVGHFLDTKLLKNPKIKKFCCIFFDFTSRITNYLLFDSVSYPLFIFSIGFFINVYYSTLNLFLLDVKVFGVSKILTIFFSMPFGFQIGILFFIVFYQVLSLNTILAYSKIVSAYMKNKYHENIMKDLHYNSGVSSISRGFWPAATAICVFCGKDAIEYAKISTVSKDWAIVSKAALEAGQTPPEHPIRIIAHISAESSTMINTADFGKK